MPIITITTQVMIRIISKAIPAPGTAPRISRANRLNTTVISPIANLYGRLGCDANNLLPAHSETEIKEKYNSIQYRNTPAAPKVKVSSKCVQRFFAYIIGLP